MCVPEPAVEAFYRPRQSGREGAVGAIGNQGKYSGTASRLCAKSFSIGVVCQTWLRQSAQNARRETVNQTPQ